MTISAFDLFKVGIGPSSSHTVGPMRAACCFAQGLIAAKLLERVTRIRAELFGSLGATGRGHGSPRAVMLGLEGETPERVAVDSIPARIARIRALECLTLSGRKPLEFIEKRDLILYRRKSLPYHPNGMIFTAYDGHHQSLLVRTYYSVGGGFVVNDRAGEDAPIVQSAVALPYPFTTAGELLRHCQAERLPISALMLKNELSWRGEAEIRAGLLNLWRVMEACVANGCRHEGILPGGLKVKRRAPGLYRKLSEKGASKGADPLAALDWVSLYAIAVNEENAAGGRVVTAPTNGAAGIIPAVLHYYTRFHQGDEDGVIRFLLTAAAIGILFKENASISGAEVGCQGEVGSACSMAAGALAEVLGGSPQQVENAAEIGMEHNLGLTCDPIGGLVQVPCIERNAVGSVKAINAARLALHGDGSHFVSLDKVIKTMRDTGKDMRDKYKETARGGLALNVMEVPVNIIEC